MADFNEYKGVWVFCEQRQGALMSTDFELVSEARKAAETLAAEGFHARVINIHAIKPLDEDIILKAARECGKIVTAEEHNVIGGLGEAVCSLLSEKLPTPVRRVGIGAVVQVFVPDGVQLGFLHQKHGLRLVSGDAHPVERVYIIGHRVAVGLQQGLV